MFLNSDINLILFVWRKGKTKIMKEAMRNNSRIDYFTFLSRNNIIMKTTQSDDNFRSLQSQSRSLFAQTILTSTITYHNQYVCEIMKFSKLDIFQFETLKSFTLRRRGVWLSM